MNLVWLLTITGIVAVGSCVQATIGFGLNLLAAPLLILVAPSLVPGPALIANLVLTAVVSRVNWKDVDLNAVFRAAVGSVPGTVLGVWMVGAFVPRLLALWSALFVIAGVGMVLYGNTMVRTPRRLTVVGFLASIMGTTTAINGPPMALMYHGESGGVVRGTVSLFGLWTTSLSLAALGLTGHLHLGGSNEVAFMAPGLVLGVVAAAILGRRMNRAFLSRLTLVVSLGAGVTLLARSL